MSLHCHSPDAGQLYPAERKDWILAGRRSSSPNCSGKKFCGQCCPNSDRRQMETPAYRVIVSNIRRSRKSSRIVQSAEPPNCAAQYLRMSRGHQTGSLQNQAAAIRTYADLHGFDIIRTYCDEGKSGLDLAHRPGLTKLLDDVLTQKADFRVVLVLDVSRWGRFQDPDESAHYEFLCKLAGVKVHYCAESFAPVERPLASLMKSLKRLAAAEYAREMSKRVRRLHKALDTLSEIGSTAVVAPELPLPPPNDLGAWFGPVR